jgi:hypothetical protein
MYTVRYLWLERFFRALSKLQHILQTLGFPHMYAVAPRLKGFRIIAKPSHVSTNAPQYNVYIQYTHFMFGTRVMLLECSTLLLAIAFCKCAFEFVCEHFLSF